MSQLFLPTPPGQQKVSNKKILIFFQTQISITKEVWEN